jgi:F0F1-type ATP synthase delta subunit
MSELATLARPYAEAVFKRAKESGNSFIEFLF